ncbi:Protein of unknown function DUF1468 [Rhabdaerophilaceae bacterium]
MARWLAEVAIALLLAALGLTIIIGASEYGVGWSSSGPEPGAFPYYMGLVIVVASLANAMRAAVPVLRPPRWSGQQFLNAEQARLVAGFVGPILGLVMVSLLLGLYVGMAIYLFSTLVFQHSYSKTKAVLIAGAAPVFTYLLIEKGFKVGMLKGPLEATLGL